MLFVRHVSLFHLTHHSITSTMSHKLSHNCPHTGVIDSGLTVVPTELLQSIKRSLLISPIDGKCDVVSGVMCRCQPQELTNGQCTLCAVL